MKNKKMISSFIDLLIFIFVAGSCVMMFTGFSFMKGPDVSLETTGIWFLKYFTVESNIFMGIMALIFFIRKILKKKITKVLYILRFASTSAVGLTFFVVFTYLSFIAPYGLISLIMNCNLFFHLIVPVLSMITFVLFEKENTIKKKEVVYGVFPTFVYGIGYLTDVLIHTNGGKVSPVYDFYYFVQYGVWTSIIVVPIIFIISYLISLLLWRLNNVK